MTDFTGRFKLVTETNFDTILKHFGVSNDKIAKSKAYKSLDVLIIKNGNIFTAQKIDDQGKMVHEFKFELGKEFDEIRFDGKTVKSVIIADGNKLIQTQKGPDETIIFLREFTGNGIDNTIVAGSLLAKRIYTRI